MIRLGLFHTLTLVGQNQDDWLLEGGDLGEVRLARRELKPTARIGDAVEVFVYTGEDGAPAATTRKPLAQLGEVACLRTLEAGRQGVWLDLGIDEALFLPRAEQQGRLEPGWKALVMLIDDERLGLIASARLNDFLEDEAPHLKPGDPVTLQIASRTDLGWKVVVNHRYWGVLFGNEVFEPLSIGDSRAGFIKRRRPDNRLDVSLSEVGYARVDTAAGAILARLEARGGFIPLGDHSDPEDIRAEFGLSKKVFKQAIGGLFRQHRIEIRDEGIALVRR